MVCFGPTVAPSVMSRCNADERSDKRQNSCVVKTTERGRTCYGVIMSSPEEEALFKEKLEAIHSFPGPFIFKVIGENTDDFQNSVIDAVRAVIPAAQPEISRRESKGARHQSLTLVVEVENSQAVVDIYAHFSKLEGIKFML